MQRAKEKKRMKKMWKRKIDDFVPFNCSPNLRMWINVCVGRIKKIQRFSFIFRKRNKKTNLEQNQRPTNTTFTLIIASELSGGGRIQ